MRASVVLMKNSLRSILVDRGMVISDLILATVIPFLIQCLIWKFIYSAERSEIEGFSFSELVMYYAFAILMGRFNNSYDLIIGFSNSVLEGTAELFCIKPLTYASIELYKFIGGGILYLIPVGVAVFVWGSLQNIQDLNLSVLLYALGVGLQILLSQILCFYIGWTTAQLCFWFVRSDFLASAMTILSAFLGGELLPPQFWPKQFQFLLAYNPFSLLVSRPAQLMVKVQYDLLTESLFLNIGYIAFFALTSVLLFNFGMRRYSSVGG